VDYPFAGGTVAITSRYCCSSFGWALPRTKKLDATPDMRSLLTGADLAMVNLEGPAPVKALYHTQGKVFTFDQSLLAGLKNAGIDVVSLANNHIGNAGKQGIRETIAALDGIGIAHGGAGADDVFARAPVIFTIQGVKVAYLAYDAIAPSYAAGPNLPGTAELSTGVAPADIKAARAAGAQFVIVFPHWGEEYRASPTGAQRTWAHQMIDAGADIVIGSHSHYAGGMETYKGKPIWYSLGNFVFDQVWSEQTEEGLTLELTFNGPNLVQAWMHPTLDLSACQPNFLDAASAQAVLTQVYNASRGLLSW
jgi:poly-gamma-glutamate synthesis protein (capsule biosynthesis protein)